MPSKKRPKRLPSSRKVSKTTRLKDRVRTWKAYGIYFESYEAALDMAEEIEKPEKFCTICGVTNEELKNRQNRGLCLDHDHVSHKPRAFLCGPCNSLVSFYEKGFLSKDIFINIVQYVENYDALRKPLF
jgi:hypothetical protein